MNESQATNEHQKEKPPAPTGGFNRALNPSNLRQTIYHTPDDSQAEREERYRKALIALPQRGGGLHGALQSVCNLGISARIPEQNIYSDVVATGRAFRRGEVEEAINTARRDVGKVTTPCPNGQGQSESEILDKRLADDPEKAKALQMKLIAAGGESITPESADLWEASSPHPTSFPWVEWLDGSGSCADMLLLLSELFQPDDVLYIGTGFEKTHGQPEHVKTRDQWIEYFTLEMNSLRHDSADNQRCRLRKLAVNFAYFIVNPVNGKRSAAGSFRSDANIETFRYTVLESDSLPQLDKQIALLNGLRLPIVSLVFSGNKSIHALIDTAQINGGKEITSFEEWQRVVKNGLFKQIKRFGFDEKTSNPSRLTRLPGIIRFPEKTDENGNVMKDAYGNDMIDYDNWNDARFQSLLYVNRKGGALCLM